MRLENILTKDDCILEGGSWINNERNFDNIYAAIGILFEIITAHGWLDVMYNAVDSVQLDSQPKENNQLWFSLFFISFMIIGNIFILNLFVGIVIDKFNRLKDKMKGYARMTHDQKEWVEAEKNMNKLILLRAVQVPT